MLRVATWNLNNRVGKVPFRMEAAHAAATLNADVVVLTEYFPRQRHEEFCRILADSGLEHQVFSLEPKATANRTLIVSRQPITRDDLQLPDFDQQFPANIVAVHVPSFGVRIVGLRVPCYKAHQQELLQRSWMWIEATAAQLQETPGVLIGDLNARPNSQRDLQSRALTRVMEDGWQRAVPKGGISFIRPSGTGSEIDHALVTQHYRVISAEYVVVAGVHRIAGTSDALSDHAALVVELTMAE